MRKVLAALVGTVLVTAGPVKAQARKEYVVRPLEKVSSVIPLRERYQLPAFEDGAVFFKNGRSTARMKMNYSLLIKNVVYIGPNGDTLQFVINSPVEFAVIGQEEFFHDDVFGYLHIIGNDDSVKLASVQRLDIIRKEKLAADGYGYVSQTIGTTSSVNIPGTNNQSTINESTVYAKKEFFFLVDAMGNAHKANRAGFLEVFPSAANDIRSLIREKDAGSYSEREHVEKMYHVCLSFTRKTLSK